MAPWKRSALAALGPCASSRDRVAADEAARRTGCLADGGLRRADVGDGRRLARGLEHFADGRGQLADRGCDDGQVRVGQGSRERGRGVDGAELAGERERLGVGVPAAHVRAGGTGSKPERRADQAGADDRDAKRRGAQRGRASARPGGTQGRATGERSGAGRAASRSATQVLLEHVVGAAEALGHVLAGELDVDAAGPDADLPARREEPFELAP